MGAGSFPGVSGKSGVTSGTSGFIQPTREGTESQEVNQRGRRLQAETQVPPMS